jgi:hypothetical protein
MAKYGDTTAFLEAYIIGTACETFNVKFSNDVSFLGRTINDERKYSNNTFSLTQSRNYSIDRRIDKISLSATMGRHLIRYYFRVRCDANRRKFVLT